MHSYNIPSRFLGFPTVASPIHSFKIRSTQGRDSGRGELGFFSFASHHEPGLFRELGALPNVIELVYSPPGVDNVRAPPRFYPLMAPVSTLNLPPHTSPFSSSQACHPPPTRMESQVVGTHAAQVTRGVIEGVTIDMMDALHLSHLLTMVVSPQLLVELPLGFFTWCPNHYEELPVVAKGPFCSTSTVKLAVTLVHCGGPVPPGAALELPSSEWQEHGLAH